jgi:phage-related minor tail protein
MGSALEGLTSIGDTIGSSLQQAFEGIISGTKSVKEAATEMVSSIVSQVSSMLVSSAIKQLIGLLQSGLGGAGGGGFLSTLLGSLAGARADGGPVMAGQSYLVGERGPEIFKPSSGGTIIPNSKAAGGPRMNVNVHIATPDAGSFQRSRTQVASVITRAVAQGQRNL